MRDVDSTNDEEWRNPDNWSGKWPFNAYFSKRDTRIFVPAFWNIRWCPATNLNHGNPFGPLIQSLFVLFALAVYVVLSWVRSHREPAVDVPQRRAIARDVATAVKSP